MLSIEHIEAWVALQTDVALLAEEDPWVETAEGMVDWINDIDGDVLLPAPTDPAECPETCHAGILVACNDEYGVQRCDQCQVYDGDIEAAIALANIVGGTAWVAVEADV